jgi:hypothetical protein
MSNSNAEFLTGAPMRHVAVMSATASIGSCWSHFIFHDVIRYRNYDSSSAWARRVMDQSQDSESEVQTHQAHQLRLFHLRR